MEHPVSRRPRSRANELAAQRTLTICVVDPQAGGDQTDDGPSWCSIADAPGTRLEFVATAEAALRLARTLNVDLWVVNTNLPQLSGYELCGMLRSRGGRTAVYLVADDYSPANERAAWAARATMFTCREGRGDLIQQWLHDRRAEVSTPAAAR